MSTTTQKLQLFKYDPVADAKSTFNITEALNENWDKIDEFAKKKGGDGFSLFDTKVCDHVLVGDEAIGWALQGSLVTMVYPDAVNRIKELYAGGDETTYREIACKRSSDGRFVADISQKPAIDELYLSTGVADFYILDSVNNNFYLPKNKYFTQLTDDISKVNDFVGAGLPNVTGKISQNGMIQDEPLLPYSDSSTFTGYTMQSPVGGQTSTRLSQFNLGAANPIYGNSDTVQPSASLKLLYYKVGNTVVNESLIDVGNILSSLNLLDAQKLNIDHSNDTKPYVKEINVNGLSGYIEFSTGLLVQWGRTPQGTVKTELVKQYQENSYIVLTTWEGTITQSWSSISIQNRLPSSFESYSAASRYWLTIGK